MALEGNGCKGIAKSLKGQGVPSPGENAGEEDGFTPYLRMSRTAAPFAGVCMGNTTNKQSSNPYEWRGRFPL